MILPLSIVKISEIFVSTTTPTNPTNMSQASICERRNLPTSDTPPPFFSSELALAAAHSAVELDCASLKRPIGFESTHQLASLLPEIQKSDGVAEVILYRSLAASELAPGWATLSQAKTATNDLLDLMKRPDSLDYEDLKRLKDFCSELISEIRSSRNMVGSMEFL